MIRDFKRVVPILIILLVAGCNFPSARPTPTATELPTEEATLTLAPTITLTPPPTASATASFTPSLTAIPPTVTPTSPPTATPTATTPVTPSATPFPTVAFVGDRLQQVDLAKQVRDGVGRQWVSFIAINQTSPTGTPGTQVAATDSEAVYIVSPDAVSRFKVIDLPASTDRRVFWSPNGAYLAYLIVEGDAPGLYVLDIRAGATSRLFALRDFTPRGFAIQPIWSPDSKELLLMLPTAYDMDIFSVAPDGSNFRNLTENGAFDLWPAWSPDSTAIVFVSDRAACPTWQPNTSQTCDGAKTPAGGGLYVMDVSSRQVRQLSEQWVSAPPRWITASKVAFTTAQPDSPDAGSSLWWVDARAGTTPTQITASVEAATPRFATNDSWSPDGNRVVYQETAGDTRVLLRDSTGQEVARGSGFSFPRYLFAAAWSPDGQKIVLGGRNGQCPVGMLILDPALKPILAVPVGASTPGICDPVWSADGKYIAYVGTSRGGSRDGRIDIYAAEASGYGSKLLSNKISGQLRFLGWIRGGA